MTRSQVGWKVGIVPGLAVLIAISVTSTRATADEPLRRTLDYAPAPIDNPLKGLVPYAGAGRNRFPHSLEFQYLSLASLVVGERQYDWSALERLLDQIAGRGHQAVFRVYLEYPDHKDVIPKYLLDRGLKVHRYLNTNTQPFPPKPVETPDYENPLLRACRAAGHLGRVAHLPSRRPLGQPRGPE
jgi:hypothetical protein